MSTGNAQLEITFPNRDNKVRLRNGSVYYIRSGKAIRKETMRGSNEENIAVFDTDKYGRYNSGDWKTWAIGGGVIVALHLFLLIVLAVKGHI